MRTTERVALNIRTIARARDMTLRSLSQRMGYRNEQVLYTRLNGGSKMSIDELEQIAEILDVDTADLLCDPADLLTRTKECFTADEGQDTLVAA